MTRKKKMPCQLLRSLKWLHELIHRNVNDLPLIHEIMYNNIVEWREYTELSVNWYQG